MPAHSVPLLEVMALLEAAAPLDAVASPQTVAQRVPLLEAAAPLGAVALRAPLALNLNRPLGTKLDAAGSGRLEKASRLALCRPSLDAASAQECRSSRLQLPSRLWL